MYHSSCHYPQLNPLTAGVAYIRGFIFYYFLLQWVWGEWEEDIYMVPHSYLNLFYMDTWDPYLKLKLINILWSYEEDECR